MGRNATGILFIILGLIVLALPLAGLITVSLLTGFALALLGIGLLIFGYNDIKESTALGVIDIVLGIIAIIFGFGFIFSPDLFAFVAGFLIYLAGIFLIIASLIAIFTSKSARWNGVISLIIGLIYLIIGYFVSNAAFYLGILIGLWLLIVGIITVLQKD